MFTGIIEAAGEILRIEPLEKNLIFTIESTLTPELKVDQSLAHNGICLTVTSVSGNEYTVAAVDETLQKTTAGTWQAGDNLNLERAMVAGARLDGHLVQGHVDKTILCKNVGEQGGSWLCSFEIDEADAGLIIEKGSICLNGVSLTCFGVTNTGFSVAIIPYTFAHTGFGQLKAGDFVNVEFDLLGKYLLRQQQVRG